VQKKVTDLLPDNLPGYIELKPGQFYYEKRF